MAGPVDASSDCRLIVPDNDAARPELTILVPALNEELTIAGFLQWCHEGIRRSGASVEILIVDSSTDRTAEIAVANGARVLKTPMRGLGRAYIDAIPHIRGQFVIMGDADCTYDFREIKPFIDAWRAGAEFVMGSRFKGSIEPDAMPRLHRYFGTPATTFLLNRMFRGRFSDIHCGMRGITRDALLRMELRSQGWEYASEMTVKSVQMGLRIVEIPIRFLKEPAGRLSHHARRGFLEPWRAGWVNLRIMFIYGIDFFLMKPGYVLLGAGLLLLLPLTFGPLSVGPVTLSLSTMLLGMTLAILGSSMLQAGGMARILFDHHGASRARYERMFPYNRAVGGSALAAAIGILMTLPLVYTFLAHGLGIPQGAIEVHWAITGLWLLITAFQAFIFTVMIRALGAALPVRAAASEIPAAVSGAAEAALWCVRPAAPREAASAAAIDAERSEAPVARG